MVIHRQTTGGFQESQGANVESVQNSENGLSSSYVVLLHPEFAENLDPSAREWPCGARFNRAPLELDTKVFFCFGPITDRFGYLGASCRIKAGEWSRRYAYFKTMSYPRKQIVDRY